ncbi:MAG: hypothetical protein OHK0045_24870 [Raineya sp.]
MALIAACSTQKNAANNQSSTSSLYQKWQLVHIERIASEEAEQSQTNFREKNLFVTFSQEGKMSFNFDVNSCSGSFKEGANRSLSFNNTDFKCTLICCDTIKINYLSVKRYEIQKNMLRLYSDKEIFHLERAK